MYSKVSVCKTCFQRVLDEQLLTERPGSCIYCLVTHLKAELLKESRRAQDLGFALEIQARTVNELVEAHDANSVEIHRLRDELDATQRASRFKVDVNSLLG